MNHIGGKLNRNEKGYWYDDKFPSLETKVYKFKFNDLKIDKDVTINNYLTESFKNVSLPLVLKMLNDSMFLLKRYNDYLNSLKLSQQKKTIKLLKSDMFNLFDNVDMVILNLILNLNKELSLLEDNKLDDVISTIRLRKGKVINITVLSLVEEICIKTLRDENKLDSATNIVFYRILNWDEIKKSHLENTVFINVHGSMLDSSFTLNNKIIFMSKAGNYAYSNKQNLPILLNSYENNKTIFIGEDMISKNNDKVKNKELSYLDSEIRLKGDVVNNMMLSITPDNFKILIVKNGKFINIVQEIFSKTSLEYGYEISLMDLLDLEVEGTKIFKNKKIILLSCRSNNNGRILFDSLKSVYGSGDYSQERRISKNTINRFNEIHPQVIKKQIFSSEETINLITSINNIINNKLKYGNNTVFYKNGFSRSLIEEILLLLKFFKSTGFILNLRGKKDYGSIYDIIFSNYARNSFIVKIRDPVLKERYNKTINDFYINLIEMVKLVN